MVPADVRGPSANKYDLPEAHPSSEAAEGEFPSLISASVGSSLIMPLHLQTRCGVGTSPGW